MDNSNLKNKMVREPKKPRTPTHVCRYCDASRQARDMKKVPDDKKELSNWVKILGPIFGEKVGIYACNYICRSHFGDNSRKHHRLPMRMENDSEFGMRRIKKKNVEVIENLIHVKEERMSEDDTAENSSLFESDTIEIETDCDSQVCELVEEDDQKKKNEEEDWLEIDVPEFKKMKCQIEVKNTNEISITTELNKENEEEDWLEIDVPEFKKMKCQVEVKETNRIPITPELASDYSQCCVCDVICHKKNLTEIPEDPDENSEWWSSLRQVFAKKIAQSFPPHFVCTDHLGVPITDLSVDEEKIEYFQCRICEVYSHVDMMTETPSEPDKMLKWFSILGPDYVKNIAQNTPPHFICTNHLGAAVTEFGFTIKE